MDHLLQFQKLFQLDTRRLLLLMGLVFAGVLILQSSTLPYGNVLSSLFPSGKIPLLGKSSSSEAYDTGNLKDDTNNRKDKDRTVSGSTFNHSLFENVSHDNNFTTEYVGNPDTGSSPAPAPYLMSKGLEEDTPIHKLKSLFLQSCTSMRPSWSSGRDHELLSAKSQINNPPIIDHDPELYPSIFRNISIFKRSYELMEELLKVYIYNEGEKPIFHEPTEPILKGIYSSEGWFMKQMERNTHFVVKDPTKAHLFYLPISSRMLQLQLYVRNSHSRDNLAEYMKHYTSTIATKYPFWNRTSGADHFLVACHDWAPFETRGHMDNCIKVLCNANIARDFNLGKDITLPTTQIHKVEDPLRGLGGNPPSQRPILAFFAGGMHGSLRPTLVQYYGGNNYQDMKIFNSIPKEGKMNYAQHMKSSKYCICPRGFDVNSPRVFEAIFYECVPVIIADDYVPPFFEVLEWEAFAVFVAEKDVGNLREILVSISEEKYLEMQERVKRVQRHFVWNVEPVKYDIFHMILHSVWFSRLNRV